MTLSLDEQRIALLTTRVDAWSNEALNWHVTGNELIQRVDSESGVSYWSMFIEPWLLRW